MMTTPPGFPKNSVLLETLKKDKLNLRNLFFTRPVEIIRAGGLDEVIPSLEKLDRYIKKGYYAAGYIGYEAGCAFIPVRKRPLLKKDKTSFYFWFGIYEKPHCFPLIKGGPGGFAPEKYLLRNFRFDTDFSEYERKIYILKKHIYCGDIYQANFTIKSQFDFEGSAFGFYRDLQKKQKTSYSAFINDGKNEILSLSPELFFMRMNEKIITRPMKGTIARGRTGSEDRRKMQALQKSAKNRAENIMIVDLLRNDFGKLCIPGTISAGEIFHVEKYKTLFTMVSTVSGRLREHTGYEDIIKNVFPCGSVTGAPKLRAMTILAGLEKSARGIYTGAIGYISPKKKAVFNVSIRTAVVRGKKGEMGTGSGIVWDSSPVEEYRETVLKTGFLSSLINGFSLIETMLLCKGDIFLLKEHLSRLEKSARYFSIPLNGGKIKTELIRLSRSLDIKTSFRVRLTVARQGEMDIKYFPAPPESPFLRGKHADKIAISPARIFSGNRFLYHKTTERKLYDTMIKKAGANDLLDYIFLNEKGEVTEGCISNIFIRVKNRLFTPPVTCGLLPGIMRNHILMLRNFNIRAGKPAPTRRGDHWSPFNLKNIENAEERIIRPGDLKNADEIFLSNSVRGLRKVRLAAYV